MTFNPIDVNSLTPSDRRQLLGWLRRKFGDSTFEDQQREMGEEALLQLAYYMVEQLGEDKGEYGGVKLSSMPRYANGSPVTDTRATRLERLRQHMGDAQYQAALKNLGQTEMEMMADRMFANPSSIYPGSETARTRESSQRLNQIILWIALAYGALLGGAYPDWVRFGLVFDSIFYWVIGVVVVIGLILVFIFKIAFDFSNIWLFGFLIALTISAVIGLAANLFSIGIKVLGVAGLALLGCWLVGVLLAKPIFRFLERLEKTWMKWVFGILAVLVFLGLLIFGWFVILAVFPAM